MNFKSGFVILFAGAVAAAQADTLALWDFNSIGDNNGSTGTTSTSIGTGTASLFGGTTATFASGNASGGSSDPLTTSDDSAWNTTTAAAQGTGSGGRGVKFAVSTVGYTNIKLKFDVRFSNTASKYLGVYYTTDGTNFTMLSPNVVATAGDAWVNGNTFDFTGVAGVANNANFAVRIGAIFAPTTTAYATANPGSTYSLTGTIRYDMVSFEGVQAVPEPATMAALGLGAFAALRRRRSK